MIRPYLSDITNDYRTAKNLRIYSSNEVIDYETQFGEWKIQLKCQLISFLLKILMRPPICMQRVIT